MGAHMQKAGILIDVVIPSVRFDSRVDGLLGDLGRELTVFAPKSGRIVVVDDQAITDVRNQLFYAGVATRSERPSPLNGPGINRNRGALNSRATWLVFLDDDVRLPEGWGSP